MFVLYGSEKKRSEFFHLGCDVRCELSALKTDLFAMLKNLGYFCTEEGRRLLDIFTTMQYNVARLLRIT